MSSRFRTSFLVLVGLLSFASRGEAQIGGWISANAGYFTPADESMVQASNLPFRAETFSTQVAYPFNGKGTFDIGGGVRVLPHVGVGVAVSRYQDDQKATIHFSVPHPIDFGSNASATALSSAAMEQRDTMVHIEARYIVDLGKANVAAFGGPTHFSVKRELVDDFDFSEALAADLSYSVAFLANTTQPEEVSVWGWNVGADASYYFSKLIGVGGMIRYSRATPDIPNDLALEGGFVRVHVGGLFTGGGVRLRF